MAPPRRTRHGPTVLLLHGWTASADLQFFTAYAALAEHYSFVAVDHRGHGRGMRTVAPFTLEDVADDAAALLRVLGIRSVITVGYSMGGPISLLLARRNPDLVDGVIVQATALEWREKRGERLRWKTIRLVGPVLRSWAYPRWLRYGLRKLLGPSHELLVYVPWIEAENRRSDPHAIVQAGRALSTLRRPGVGGGRCASRRRADHHQGPAGEAAQAASAGEGARTHTSSSSRVTTSARSISRVRSAPARSRSSITSPGGCRRRRRRRHLDEPTQREVGEPAVR